jgi:flagellar hook-length control protein FliK
MSGGESVRAGKEKLLMAVRVLAQESARQEAGELDKASALREAVARVFLMAREREASRSRADHGPDDTARKYRLLAEDNARNDSAESGEKTARDGSRAERVAERWLSDGKPSGAEDAAARAAHKQESREAGALGERARLRAEVKEDGAAARDGKDSGSEKFGGDRESKASADERRAVREFTAKIRSDAAVNLRAEAGAERADAAAAQRAAEIFKDGPGNFEQILRQEGSSARQVLSQVRAGMLKNIAPGRQQLTLQLDPPDLGKLHLMLQVSNNEVRAVIRADNHEAGRLLAEHMAQLKAGLEAQGLRVNKLEVQTNAQNNDGPQQQGQQQQAGGQEGGPGQGGKEKAGRAGLLGRWLRGEVDEEALAQEMQNAEEKARTSPRGLDLFA